MYGHGLALILRPLRTAPEDSVRLLEISFELVRVLGMHKSKETRRTLLNNHVEDQHVQIPCRMMHFRGFMTSDPQRMGKLMC